MLLIIACSDLLQSSRIGKSPFLNCKIKDANKGSCQSITIPIPILVFSADSRVPGQACRVISFIRFFFFCHQGKGFLRQIIYAYQ